MSLRTPSLLLLSTLATWSSVRAQEGLEEKVRIEQREQRQNPQERLRQEHAQKGGDAGDGTSRDEADGAAVSRAPGESISNACSVVALQNPPRLGPGETGTLTLVCALQHRAVIQADAGWKVTYEANGGTKGEVQLGAWSLKQAGIGTLEDHFKGKPVYDNQAQVLIPISVGANTAHGKYRVTMNLEVPLTDGATGQLLGLFRAAPSVEVNVGAPMPKTVLRGATPQAIGAAGPGDTVAAVPEHAKPKPKAAGSTEKGPETIQGGSLQAASGAKPAPQAPATTPEVGSPVPEGEGGFPFLIVGIAAGALVLLVLVLAQKRG